MTATGNRLKMLRIAALVTALSYAAAARADDPAFNAAAGITAVTGAQVYQHICQGCHMPDAQGAVGAGHYPKLAGDPALVSWEYVALTILNGRNGMPAFGQPVSQATEFGAVRLSDSRIADVVNYLRNHFGNRWKGNVTAAQVASLPHPP